MSRLIHVAKIEPSTLLFLREEEGGYRWSIVRPKEKEEPSPVHSSTIEEAIREARIYWHDREFTPLHCGYRYVGPDRDEHGMNAYFYQMVESYRNATGNYYDSLYQCPIIVQNASAEALALWRQMESEGRI